MMRDMKRMLRLFPYTYRMRTSLLLYLAMAGIGFAMIVLLPAEAEPQRYAGNLTLGAYFLIIAFVSPGSHAVGMEFAALMQTSAYRRRFETSCSALLLFFCLLAAYACCFLAMLLHGLRFEGEGFSLIQLSTCVYWSVLFTVLTAFSGKSKWLSFLMVLVVVVGINNPLLWGIFRTLAALLNGFSVPGLVLFVLGAASADALLFYLLLRISYRLPIAESSRSRIQT